MTETKVVVVHLRRPRLSNPKENGIDELISETLIILESISPSEISIFPFIPGSFKEPETIPFIPEIPLIFKSLNLKSP